MNIADKDLYEYLLNFADDRVVLNMLSVNKQFRDDKFFEQILKRRYPAAIKFKPANQSWREYYIETIYYVEKIKDMLGYIYSATAMASPWEYYRDIRERIKWPNDLLHLASVYNDSDLVKYLIEVKKADIHYFKDIVFRNAK